MDKISLAPMERRLRKRYLKLVEAHMHCATAVAAGPTAVLSTTTGFAQTQAMWRFLNNDRVGLDALIQPPRAAARQAVEELGLRHVLLIHDWSKVAFGGHPSKQDTAKLTHDTDVGYELTTGLAVSPADGSPLAPMQMHLKTAKEVLSTSPVRPGRYSHHLQQVLPMMRASADWGLAAKLVHVIDREADSVGHMRRWDKAGHWFLVRADDRKVLWEEQPILLSALVQKLRTRGGFVASRQVEYRGALVQQYVAETTVTLYRPAKKRVGKKRRQVRGRPLALRLVVAQLRNDHGRVVAQWMLLTNLPPSEADAGTIALWYYWRWRIESFFKLLKSGGQQLEHWQQETAPAIARRLLVASMACVVVWGLERRRDEKAQELKKLLVQLSGRQVKRTRPCTASAMLAGLFVLLPILELIRTHGGDLRPVQELALSVLPFLKSAVDV